MQAVPHLVAQHARASVSDIVATEQIHVRWSAAVVFPTLSFRSTIDCSLNLSLSVRQQTQITGGSR